MRYIAMPPVYAVQIAVLRHIEAKVGGSFPHITVILESIDFSNDATVRDDFKFPAFCWRRGDPQDFVPVHVAVLMNDPECEQIIWLSKNLVEDDEIHLAWVFAHELCHILQATGIRDVSELKRRLYKLHVECPHLRSGTQLDCAGELDSEVFAKTFTRELFGIDAFDAYLSRQRTRQNGAAYHGQLELLETSLCGAG